MAAARLLCAVVRRRVLLSSSGRPLRCASDTADGEVHLAESCVRRLQQMTSGPEFLRLQVDSGGCSGFQYKFYLDTIVTEDDRSWEEPLRQTPADT